MLITFKTLEQKTFKIEIEETEKVIALKEKIAQERGGDQFPVAGQKLIYSGKILDDEKLISECNIDQKNFVVVMVVKQKPKPVDKPKEAETSTSSESTGSASTSVEPMSVDTASPAPVSESASETSTTTTASSDTPSTQGNTPDAPLNTTEVAESTLLTGSALESSITELMSLGYSREQVMVALNRSYHNADRAAEYLLSGHIPEALPGESEGGGDGSLGSLPAEGISAEDLSFLRNSSQFQRMRSQVQSNPGSLPMLLQGIGETNPDLLALINQNQEQFISLLNEQPDADVGQGGAGGGGDGGAGAPFQIQVTTSEKEAIDRIVAMGFPEAEVIQAFFACDKNEQLAIDLLLSS